MKFFKITIFLFLISNLCYASINNNIYICKDNTVKELIIEGNAHFDNCKSNHNIIINGNITTNNSNLNNNITIVGRSNLINSIFYNSNFFGQLVAKFVKFSNLFVTENAFIHEGVITNTSQIFGNIFADNVIFHDKIELFGNNNIIKNSVIHKNIILKESLKNNNHQIITLESTLIIGNIIIENKNSIINLTKNSLVKGEIINTY